MKKIINSILCLMIITGAVMVKNTHAEEAKLSVPVSFSYSSVYWWRGVVLNDGAGVMWPGVGVSYGDFSFTAATGISENWITSENTAEGKNAKSYSELDLGAVYTLNKDKFSIAFGLMYIGYPYYDETDSSATDASFIEGSVIFTLKTLLSPYVAFYYDYYLHEKDAKTPVNEDYYVKAGISHNLISTEYGFTFSLGAYMGYYNNAYSELSGFSDAVVKAGLSKNYKNASFTSGFYYGRTLGDDFRKANGGKKNNFWADFGVSMTL